MAAPAPWTNLAAISIPGPAARPHASEAATNDRDPGEEHPLPANQVAQPAAEQQQAAERDEERVHHPAQAVAR